MAEAQLHLAPLLTLAALFALFLFVGLVGRRTSREYYLVSQRSPGHMGIGAAIASNWMSAASFLGIAGVFFLKGYFALAFVIGWTGGYVLLLVLMAGQLRRFGKYTAPEFVGDRYESDAARVLSAIITICISLIYCVAQFKGIGLIFSWIFGIGYTRALLLGAILVLGYMVVAGALGASRNQQLQYTVLLLAFLVPLMVLARHLGFGWLLPQVSYGAALHELATAAQPQYTFPWSFGTPYQWMALCFTLMVGTAGLPHVLSRFYTVRNIRDARWSVVWGIFFIGLVYWSAPAFAAFAKVWQLRNGLHLDAEQARQVADLIVIYAGEWAGLPDWLTGIVAVGAISAAFYTLSGLLITGAGAFSYDIYYRFINPQANERRRVRVAKAATLVLSLLVVGLAVNPPGLIAEIAALAFALAGNTLFPVFLLGIWWERANKYGAIAGMLTGVGITLGSLLWADSPLLGAALPPTSSALIGAPLVSMVIITVSLVTPPPSARIHRLLVDTVHEP